MDNMILLLELLAHSGSSASVYSVRQSSRPLSLAGVRKGRQRNQMQVILFAITPHSSLEINICLYYTVISCSPSHFYC